MTVVCVDPNDPTQRPVTYTGTDSTALEFIAFDDLKAVHRGNGAPFRGALIDLEDAGTEPLGGRVPTIYGPSWDRDEEVFRDGSITMFAVKIDGDGEAAPHQLAFGTQDLAVDEDGRRTLIGLPRPATIGFTLDLRASDFEARCRRRGHDPDELRARFGGGGA